MSCIMDGSSSLPMLEDAIVWYMVELLKMEKDPSGEISTEPLRSTTQARLAQEHSLVTTEYGLSCSMLLCSGSAT